jgi:PEP-CTERM motif-containing protein
LLAIACFIVPDLRGASVQLISADRHANVSALAGAQEGSESSSKARKAKSFIDFHADITAMAQWMDVDPPFPGGTPEQALADANATQDSTLSTTDFFFHSFIRVQASGNNAGPFEEVNADALSFFQVSFSVSTPIVFNLSFFDERDYIFAEGGTYDKTFDLTSALFGSILGPPVDTVDQTTYYSGLLLPGDTYTLLVSQHANTTIPDPLGSDVFNLLEAHMTFSDVPEPSALLSLLIGLGLLLLVRSKFPLELFCAQRAHRIDLRRASRRQPRRD